MEYSGAGLIVIGLVLLFISYLYYQSLDARVTSAEHKMKDELLRMQSVQGSIDKNVESIRYIRENMRGMTEQLQKHSESTETIVQEIIAINREVSKLRPIVKVTLPKEIIPKKEVSKRGVTK